MKYKAMPGSIIIRVKEQESVDKRESGLFVVESKQKAAVEVAEVVAVGDEREDILVGTKIVFPTSTGLKIDSTHYYLKYEDVCAIVNV